jgi:hypothetical protein
MMVFEQVLLFTFGVIILVTSFALFTLYQNYYVHQTGQDQITLIKEQVISHIVDLCKGENINSSVAFDIPEVVGNSFYRISLSQSGLNVSMRPDGKINDFSSLYGLNDTFSFGGSVMSEMGQIVIYKKGNSIIIQ